MKTCPKCDGAGVLYGNHAVGITCPTCKGRGKVRGDSDDR
jgi:DnaJ-class molecular chaperone